MTFGEIWFALFICATGIGMISVGDTNAIKVAALAQTVLDEQLVEWTAYSNYETAQPVQSTSFELNKMFHVTLTEHYEDGCRGMNLTVIGQQSDEKDTLFVPQCF